MFAGDDLVGIDLDDVMSDERFTQVPLQLTRPAWHERPHLPLEHTLPAGQTVVLEIQDSKVYDLDLSTVAGMVNEDGGPNLQLNQQLIIRAGVDCRPVVRLRQPLRFRYRVIIHPGDVNSAGIRDAYESWIAMK